MTPPASAATQAKRLATPARLRTASYGAGAHAPALPVPRRRPARPRPLPPSAGLTGRALGLIVAVPEHRLLDRLVRGRLWIGLVAFALIGIVAMQLLVLKLNTGIGTELQRAAQLQRENAAVSIENSTASAGENIEPQATRRGMQIAPAGAVGFLDANPSDTATAASKLRHWNPAPSASSSNTSTESATTAAPEESTQPPTSSAPTTPTAASEPSSEASSQTSATESAGTSTPTASETPAEPTSGSEVQATATPATASSGGTQAQG